MSTVVSTDASTTPDAPGSTRRAWGYGLATTAVGGGSAGQVLDTWYPSPALGAAPADDSPYAVPAALAALEGEDTARGVRTHVVRTEVDLDAAPADVPDAYLRLHLLSARLAAPRTLNLDGLFGVLNNVVWTDRGPCAVAGFEQTRLRLRAHGAVQVLGVDKFPRMVDYVLPTGVRVADADRVRLGAHLAEGTTVMHEGFVNFNAGTLGASMVEGRISAGVVVGDGSDVGGGASIMGTLSGGGTQVVSVGRRSLLGANAGIGISLGDDCVVEAGLYVTAGTKVVLTGDLAVANAPEGWQPGDEAVVVKARDLSGRDGLLLRRNSTSGAVEAVALTKAAVVLNDALHAN